MASAFDEMLGAEGEIRDAYVALKRWLDTVPPDHIALRRSQAELFFRRIGITFAVYGDAEATERLIPFDIIPRVLTKPEWLRSGSRAWTQRVKALNMFLARRLRHAGMPEGRHRPGGPGLPQRLLPAGDGRPQRAARHLRPHRRDRYRPRRPRHLLRAGGQCPHALRRLLHAGEPRSDDAALPGAVRRAPRRAGRQLSRLAARDATLGRAAQRVARPGLRAADAGTVQFGLLRALLPGRQAGHRAGRGLGSLRARRRRLHAHDRGPQARRRHLPAHRRRLPRSAGLPAELDPRRSRA